MVLRLPDVQEREEDICQACLVGKQHKEAFKNEKGLEDLGSVGVVAMSHSHIYADSHGIKCKVFLTFSISLH
jgi:hypothetical protein